jgi:hypothetical protein
MPELNGFVIGILVGGAGVVALYLAVLLLLQPERNKKLIGWCRTVPITESQKFAMEYIWDSHINGRNFHSIDLIKDTLLNDINQQDWEYILTICDPSFRPPEFGSAKPSFDIHVRYLEGKGYAEEFAKIVIGMKLNGYVARFALERRKEDKKRKLFAKKFRKK